MIQIEDTTVITGIVILFLFAIAYVSYVLIRTKLFPQTIEFKEEIKPNENTTVASVKGSVIIKKVEIITTQNDSMMNITVDQTSHMLFNIKTASHNKEKPYENNVLTAEINLYTKFHKYFGIYIQNQSDTTLSCSGSVYYEIRKPLSITLKTLISEILS